MWAPEPGSWIFRGHADARWRLLPSANRRKFLLRFMKSAAALAGDDRYCEPHLADLDQLLREFAAKLDDAGLPMPGGRQARESLGLGVGGPHFIRFDELAALGQHYELPTILLDWTTVGIYGAYFAASELAEVEREDPGGKINVWALRMPSSPLQVHMGGRIAEVRKVVTPRAGNPNLHSQGGVFTKTIPPFELGDPNAVLATISIDEIVGAAHEAGNSDVALRRLSLPRSEAREVLRLLGHDRVGATALFPGLQGVVRSVRDERDKR
jgi:hypothetical protein